LTRARPRSVTVDCMPLFRSPAWRGVNSLQRGILPRQDGRSGFVASGGGHLSLASQRFQYPAASRSVTRAARSSVSPVGSLPSSARSIHEPSASTRSALPLVSSSTGRVAPTGLERADDGKCVAALTEPLKDLLARRPGDLDGPVAGRYVDAVEALGHAGSVRGGRAARGTRSAQGPAHRRSKRLSPALNVSPTGEREEPVASHSVV
jgi:hypothetical protein